MGMGPDITRVGDVIVVVIGACTPFVVRPARDASETVGECYVHGVMDGEVFKEDNWERLVEWLDVV